MKRVKWKMLKCAIIIVIILILSFIYFSRNLVRFLGVKDVIGILSNQTMRRKIYGSGKINFNDTHEITIIQIHHRGKLLTVNGIRYSLYGYGIDTIKLLEAVSFED